MARQNTPGLGIEYEVHIPAYFSLLLNNNEDVEDFKLRSNAEEFGNLDDLLIDIRTKSGEELYFAFQLKHKENHTKNLLPTNFEARGDFNLEKYCEAFKNLSEENRKYHFVLYTNKNFDCTRKEEVTKFRMEHDDRCAGKRFFNTSPDVRNVYKFEIGDDTEDGKNVTKKDYQLFFSQFTLYTGQINFNDLNKSHILDILKYEEQFLKYVNFFRRWHRGEFLNKIVDKETLNVHLIDIFLAPFVIKNYHLSNGEENLELFESILRIFDLTIIDDSKANFIDNLFEYEILEYENRTSIHFKKQLQKYMKMYKIDRQKLTDNPKKATEECLLRLGKEIKIIDRYTKELRNDTKLKLFCYFFQKPLIVDFNETSKELIYQATQLYKMSVNKIKFVFLGQEIDVKKFQNFQIFENLRDLLTANEDYYGIIVERCNLLLQGRCEISLEKLIKLYEEITDFTKPKEIFQMLKGNYSTCKKRDELPQYYIPRTVSTHVFDMEAIISQHIKSEDLIIINFRGRFVNFESIIKKQHVRVIGIQEYLNSYQTHALQRFMITSDEECSRRQFEAICDKNRNRNIHYLKIGNDTNFMLAMSSHNIFKLHKFKLPKMYVEEDDIEEHFNNPVNILCTNAGMGKSTLMNSLTNKLTSDFWALRIDLKVHNTFLKENRNGEEFLHYLMQLDDSETEGLVKKLKTVHLKHRKVLILLDGLDEIESVCIDNVLNYTEELSKLGYRIWLSSRQNLRQRLENHFNIFAIDIDELNKKQQEKYVLDRLLLKYQQLEAEEIATKIFSSADIVKNQKILGIPLQLSIITQIFLNNQHHTSFHSNIFLLTQMYKIFFEGRYEYSLSKLGHQQLSDWNDQLEKYEIAALQSLFDDEIFSELDLDLVLDRNRRFLEKIKRTGDPLGIIVKVNSEDKAVFEHFSFGEYFASAFLTKNFSRAQILEKQIFSERYENLFLIFNMMLTEESPLHLAVLYRDLDQIKIHLRDGANLDKGGRNLLHLAACNATRHPLLSHNRFFDYRITNVVDHSVVDFDGETPPVREIIHFLLNLDIDLSQEDHLFKRDSLHYALQFGSLYAAEAILGKCGIYVSPIYHDDINLTYYSIRFGYPNLLSSVLTKDFPLTRISCSSLHDCLHSKSILYFSVMLERENQIKTIRAMLKKNSRRSSKKEKDKINTLADSNGYTLLHFATIEENLFLVQFLISEGANVNNKDSLRCTPLHCAAAKGNIELMNLLLSKGANINQKDACGFSPLSLTAFKRYFEATMFLIEAGADVDVATMDGSTILHYAAKHRIEKEMIASLLDNSKIRPLVNVTNKKGELPLHFAVFNGQTELVELLLSKGTNLDRVNAWSRKYPLHYALQNGRLQEELLLKLTDVVRNKLEQFSADDLQSYNMAAYLRDNEDGLRWN